MTNQAMASARRLQVLIGDDLQDWSSHVIEFSAGWSQRDTSGIIFTRGKLRLGMGDPPRIPPDTMNTRSAQGRQRWRKGQRIIINCTDVNGNLQRHPCGWLYILKPPAPWSPANQELEIELGCVLSLRNYKDPDEVISQNPTGTIDRTSAIAIGLSKAGVTNPWLGQVPKHPVPFMITKEGTSNIELCGKLAYGGLEIIYQDNYGNIRTIPASVQTANPLTTVRIGQDEIAYDPLDNGEFPSEEVRYTGITVKIEQQQQTVINQTIEWAPASVVAAELGNEIIVVKITETKDTINEAGKVQEQKIYMPWGLISPTAYPKDTALTLAQEVETRQIFDGYGEVPLRRIESTEKAWFPAVCASYFENQSDSIQRQLKDFYITSKQQTTYYEYNEKGVIQQITINTLEPVAALVSDEKLTTPAGLVNAELQTTNWAEIRANEWQKIETLNQPLIRQKPDIQIVSANSQDRLDAKLAVTTKSQKIETSSSGQTQPPATERKPQLWSYQDQFVEGAALFPDQGNPNEPRRRTFSLDVGCSGAGQLSELAQLEGWLLIGRAYGMQLQIPFLDSFFTTPQPLPQINVIETEIAPQGHRKNLVVFQADGIQFTHNDISGVVGTALVWVAIQEGEWQDFDTEPVTPTYSPSVLIPPYEAVQIISRDETNPATSPILEPTTFTYSSYLALGFGFTADQQPYLNPPTLDSTLSLAFSFYSDDESNESRLCLGLSFESAEIQELIPSIFAMGMSLGSQAIDEIHPLVMSLGFGLVFSDREQHDLELSLGLGFETIIDEFDRALYGLGISYSTELIELHDLTLSSGYAMGSVAILDYLRTELTYFSPNDTNGVFYYLGTNYGTAAWTNPHNSGAINITASSIQSGNTASLAGRTNSDFATFASTNNTWVRVDLGVTKSMQVNAYTLQHYSQSINYIRNWALQGSNNGTNWFDLDVRIADTTISSANGWGVFTVPPETGYYRYFRINLMGVNSSNTWVLALSELELYGQFMRETAV